ncbi:MAG: SIMPL domain-containing protein [Atribacterota bacterium]|nr:SIMPL domain-containing protein [Atribacterota bacterium]MDD4895480.1 SIMPL domain-containing protein [Atribacterota bacterium]MDD5637885.1 SIMPL domain-containing protein [Atribacterota bacterium]
MEEEKYFKSYNFSIAFLILGISIVLAALIFGVFFYQTRSSRDFVQVLGAATQGFESDIVKWNIILEENTDLSNIRDGYRNIQEKRDRLVNILKNKGILSDDINVNPISTQKRWNRDGEVVGYVLNQSLFTISREVEVIEELALNPDELLNQDIFFQVSSLEYFYSEIDTLRKDLLELATRNARERAEMILKESGHKAGKMIWSQAGVFQIVEPYSTEVESYGMYNTASRRKEIKVTVHAQFLIQ